MLKMGKIGVKLQINPQCSKKIGTPGGCSLLLPQKRAPFFDKTGANAQQVFPVQAGLHQYDEWMVQDINNKKLKGS